MVEPSQQKAVQGLQEQQARQTGWASLVPAHEQFRERVAHLMREPAKAYAERVQVRVRVKQSVAARHAMDAVHLAQE